jgi:hypothetical protein
MGICKPEPRLCDSINIWSGDLPFFIKTGYVSITEVIGQDKNNIGPFLLSLTMQSKQEYKKQYMTHGQK